MSRNRIAVKRTTRRTAVVLAAGAVALGLAAVPAAAVAMPAPAQVSAAPVRGDVAVQGGSTTFTLPAEVLAQLKAQGLTLAWVDATGQVRRTIADPAKGMTLGVSTGSVAATASGQATGRISYAAPGFAVVNAKTNQALRVNNFAADLTKGELLASVNGGSQVVIGSFQRPAVDTTTVDLASRVMSVSGSVRLNAAVVQQMNQAAGAEVFAADKVAFDTRTVLALDGQADLQDALGLQAGTAVEPGVEAGPGA